LLAQFPAPFGALQPMSWLVPGEVPGALTPGGGAAVPRSPARGGGTVRVAAGEEPRPETSEKVC
jgi:hypothetical protein